jgi:asparagine synthase (glutamine-hydrolysing)
MVTPRLRRIRQRSADVCGITAVLSPSLGATTDLAERGARALAHRGPDGRGARSYGGGLAALGHARLALVDALGGAQPIENEDGAIACVVSGELYDEARLRAELEARGHRFRTKSDSELAVHLYEEHGDAFVQHLRGEFAIALWDGRARRLVCARDRFGVRPLVWARTHVGILVASEAKALFAMGVHPRWDREALWLSMCAQYAPADRTLFEGVRQVPPGHLLIADERGARVVRYWDLDLPRAEDKRDVSPDELRAALDDAVTVRMRGDHGTSACALSGGLDSSAVAALASRKARVACFTLSFTGDYDERAIAERTAKALGAPLRVVSADARALWDALPAAVAQSEGLSINLHVAAKWLLAREVRRAGHRVLFTGEGADEVLAGYAHFRRDLLVENGVSTTDLASQNGVSAGLMLPEGDTLDTSAVGRAVGFVPSWIAAKAALGFRASSLLARDFTRAFCERDPYAEMVASFDLEQLRGRERIDQAAYTWSKLALAGYILRTLGDGTEMAHAVEGRVPFLDHRFFEIARAARTSQKIRGEVEKSILREAMKDALPEEVIARRKHPLLAPPSATTSDEAADVLRGPLPAMFDARAVKNALKNAQAPAREQTLWDPPLMLVLTATLIARAYGLEDA